MFAKRKANPIFGRSSFRGTSSKPKDEALITLNPRSAIARAKSESVIPTITSQKLKTTELVERDGVEVKNQTIPSSIGFVTDPIMFCRKPATASSRICVKVPVSSCGTIGESSRVVAVPGAELSVSDWLKMFDMKAAAITITRPIRAFLIVLLASSRATGSPVEVIYRYPPRTIKNTTAIPASARIAVMASEAKWSTSGFEAAKATLGKRSGSSIPILIISFFII
ncbi:MAG: hypothetical protein BWZ03_00351 [bacterium ADurb.BinA186]|nr:MAG: hypothetical protein BWZ03_00351 [bacterium ADurb.BinA186]